MILDKLFDTTNDRWKCGVTSGQFTEEFASIPADVTDFPDSYWLGYISADDLPACFKRSTVVIDKENDSVKFVKSTVDENCPCGYVFTSSSGSFLNTKDFFVDGNFTDRTVNFINNLHPEYSGYGYISNATFQLTFQVFLHDAEGNVMNTIGIPNANSANELVATSPQMTTVAFYDFLYNSAKFEINVTLSGVNYIIEISSETIASGNALIDTDAEGVQARVFTRGIRMPYLYIQDGQTVYYFNINFMSKMRYDDGENQSEYARYLQSVDFGSSSFRTNNSPSESNIEIASTNVNFYPYTEAELTLSELVDQTKPYSYGDGFFTRWVFASGGGYSRYISAVLTIDDVKKMVCLMYRFSLVQPSVDNVSYIKDRMFPTDVASDGRFRARWKNGNIGDDNFKATLQPWQYESFAENEFTEDDIPDYTPDPDDGDDIPEDPDVPDADGDDIENQTDRTVTAPTNFITYYVLNAQLIETFGKILWGEMLDDAGNYWQNFATKVMYDTGSYNVQSIFNFLVSLRIFPFSVSTMPITIASGNEIKIGSGKVPIPVKGTVRRLTSILGDLYAGKVTLKLNDPYKDFRDLANTKVICYLPYCGTVELNPVEVIGRELECHYSIDFSTGDCIAIVSVVNDGHLYNVAVQSGSIGALVPLTATNAGQVLAQRSIDMSQGSLFAMDAMSGFFSSIVKGTENPLALVSGALDFMAKNERGNIMEQQKVLRSAIGAPVLSGGSGIASFMLPKTAYIQVRRGQYIAPTENDMPHTQGYTNASAGKLSSFKGSKGLAYVECVNPDVSGLKCTHAEKQAIKSMLENGVYV